MADALGIPAAGGALVAGPEPAAKLMNGEIQIGDVITRFNDELAGDPRDLARKAAWLPADRKAVLSLYSDGKVMTVEVPVLRMEAMMHQSATKGPRPITPGLRFAAIPGAGPNRA